MKSVIRIRRWLFALALAAALQGCNTSRDSTTPLPAPPTTDTPFVQPQPSSTVTLTPIPTRTPEALLGRVKLVLVNCRIGPGTVYGILNELEEGQSVRITGRNEQGTWYYVRDPGNPGGFCWLSAEVVEVSGDVSVLPVVPPPGPSVTNVNLVIEPDKLVVACDAFPQPVYMTAEITTDGPALVTYRWEASTGATSVDTVIAFEGAGTKVVRDYYLIAGPNDYWIRIHVLGPNDVSDQANFRVICN